MSSTSSELIRLNKLVAASGACSRREADRFLARGWIRVSGLSATDIAAQPGTKVPCDTRFEFLPPALEEMSCAVSLVFHKPVGVVSSQPETPNQVPAVKHLTAENRFVRQRQQQRLSRGSFNKQQQQRLVANPYQLSKLAVVGRLDVQSSGLLLFTQSGRLAQAVIGPDSHVEKEYLVRLTQSLDEHNNKEDDAVQERLKCLLQGVYSQGELLEAADIRLQNSNQLNFVLTAGRYHHIRRMCEAVDWQVQALKRVRIGSLRLEDLPVGTWRHLEPTEYNALLHNNHNNKGAHSPKGKNHST